MDQLTDRRTNQHSLLWRCLHAPKNTKYALRAADPRVANGPADGWPPEGRIIMTPYLSPEYYPFSVPLIMEFTNTQS
jgi:hypothetical protein